MRSSQPQRPDLLRTHLLPILGVALIYACLARLCLLLAIPGTNTSPVWAPSGFAFAAVLILGRRVWPGITLGAFVGNILTFMAHPPASFGLLLAASIVISLGNTGEALAGSFLLERLIGKRSPLDRTQDSVALVFAAAAMCLVACTVGPTFLCVSGIAHWALYPTIWSTWWIGDTTGILIVTPTLLAWFDRERQRLTAAQIAELIVSVAVVLAMAAAFFGGRSTGSPLHRQIYLILPPLLWIVFRFHAREALTTAAVVSVIAVHSTIQGHGTFAMWRLNTSLELLQIFISVLSITTMMLGSVCAERARAQKEAAERAERQRAIAGTLQQAMQPSEFPQIPGLNLACFYKAALDEANIGGDFYDIFPISDSHCALVIGDISGKGLAAAIQVAGVRNMLRCALYLRDNPAVAVSELNRIVNEYNLVAGFATVFVGIYDSKTRRLTHISCGHEPALRYNAESTEVSLLSPTGPPIGIGSFEYTSETATLCPGDVVLLNTDGITEVKLHSGELLGVDALSRMLSTYAPQSTDPAVLIDRIIAEVENVRVEPFRDDACLIALYVQ